MLPGKRGTYLKKSILASVPPGHRYLQARFDGGRKCRVELLARRVSFVKSTVLEVK